MKFKVGDKVRIRGIESFGIGIVENGSLPTGYVIVKFPKKRDIYVTDQLKLAEITNWKKEMEG